MIILKDSWIGLIQTPTITTAIPEINNCNVEIEEIYNSTGTYSPTTNADINVYNLDVNENSISGIYSIKVDLATYDDQNSYFQTNDYVPINWTNIETRSINSSSNGILGKDNTLSLIFKNIPTNPKGFYHKFRIQFLNNRSLAGKFLYDMVPILGTMSNNIFTVGTDDIINDGVVGFSFNLLNSNKKIVNATPVIAHSNTVDTVSFCSNIQYFNGHSVSDVAYITPVSSEYYYAFGLDGLGTEFNGINDLSEIAGVENLEAEPMINSWISTDEYVLDLQNNSIRLRFDNMYNHTTTSGTIMADGTIRDISNAQWLASEYYVVFARFATNATLPIHKYPIDDAYGKWYKIKEVPVVKQNIEDIPKIVTTISDLPRGSYMQFFVGVMTDFTLNTTDMAPQTDKLVVKHDMSLTIDVDWSTYNG